MWDVRKRKMAFVKAALSLMGIVKNGHSPKGVQYIDAQESIMYSFVVCVKNFLVSG